MSRYFYTSREFQTLKVGDKCIISSNADYRSPTTYSIPLNVIKITKTQFTLAAEDMDSKPLRFKLDGGAEWGTGNYGRGRYAHVATDKYRAQVAESNKAAKVAQQEKAKKANAEELRMREKYQADIVSDAVQDVLRPVRTKAEYYDNELVEIFGNIGGATAEDPSKLIHFLSWSDDRASRIEEYTFCRDTLSSIHGRLVIMVKQWAKGSSFELTGSATNSKVTFDPATDGEAGLVRLLKSTVGAIMQEQVSNYFSNNRNDNSSGQFTLIYELRDILEMRWDYPRVEIIVAKKEEEAA